MTVISPDDRQALRAAVPRGADDLTRVAPVAAVAFVLAWGISDGSDGLRFAGHDLAGVAFWAVASLTAGLLAGVLASPGRSSVGHEAAGLPASVRAAGTACGGTLRFVAIGFVVAMLVVGLWLLPAVDAALAALLVVLLVTPGRRLLAALALAIWRMIARADELPGAAPPLPAAVLLGVGGVGAFLFAALVEATVARAIAAGVVALAMVLRRSTPAAAAVVATALVPLAVLAGPVAAGQADEVEVRGDKATYVATGIQVSAGEVVRVEATGTVRFLEGDDEAEAEADGGPAFYLGCGGPTFCGALAAKIGEDGVARAIGETGSMTADRAGELHLGVNDFDFEDNSGSFTVIVEVTAPVAAEPGTATTVPVTGGVPAGSPDEPGDAPDPLPSALFAAIAAVGAGLGFPVGRSWGSLPPPWFEEDHG